MRIIAGTHRGKKLLTPTDERIRPTADRAREAVFSIILSKFYPSLENIDVLDVFSGTGALGLEAASRGAKSVTFVDVDLVLTQKNATLCKFENLSFIKTDATRLGKLNRKFSLVFTDAPYHMNLTAPVLDKLVKNECLNNGAMIVAETAKDEDLEVASGLELVDERGYGAAKFWFFKF